MQKTRVISILSRLVINFKSVAYEIVHGSFQNGQGRKKTCLTVCIDHIRG
jgi:hypothetical protein